jgi:CRISPR system Cascade subunit CasD
MMEYLLFRLYGPLASWGEIAVGESRHTATYPGKSALLGLLAAALGIRRDD